MLLPQSFILEVDVRIKYLGHREKKAIRLPIGSKRHCKEIVWADPYCELPDSEAKELLRRDTHGMYEAVEIDQKKTGTEFGCSAEAPVVESSQPVKRRRGRPRKNA